MFPPGEHPYPDAAVLARWERTLPEPGVTVLVREDLGGLGCFLAHDGWLLRHLAVRPDLWGRGYGADIMAEAERAGVGRLWVLKANHRAIGMYRRRGWRRTGAERAAEWPPYPAEIELRAP